MTQDQVTHAGPPVASQSAPDQVERRKRELHARVDRDFTYHAPKEAPDATVLSRYTVLREEAKRLAHQIVDLVPAGREQSTALTRLEEAIMHANAGIARGG